FTRHGYSVPFRKTVCTLRLARWLMKGETRDLRLETLAGTIGTAARPCHRAFPDAQATLELFHRLLELAGPVGVLTFEDLISFTRVGRKPDIGKASLAAKVPRVPGVYRFLDIRGRVLYVGKAKNLRSRVRSYFYGDERPRLGTLVREIAKVEFERTNSELAAEVRELELIRQHQPRYNRRNRRTGRSPVWIRIADGKIPRLVVTRKASDQAPPLLGPFTSQKQAKEVLEALRDAYPMPRCTDPRKHPDGCAFGQMGRCIAPCLPGRQDPYQDLFDQMIDCINSDPHSILERLNLRMSALAEDMRYEEAADLRDRIELLARTFDRQQIVQSLMLSGDVLLDFSEEQSPVCVAIRQGRLVAVHPAPDGSGYDIAGIFAFAPPPRTRQWVTYEEWEEMQIIWRHLGKHAKQGARVLWCSGLLFLPS
ncbi:MAG TPA: GIY-YIG nuclease family protein, partial [Actinomycetota bacterium]|nr:GIY-YIG nuclease family protein [Actinomycetota bacterium]